MVCLEGDVHEDALEAVGFSVWRGLDEGCQPGLQADGRKGRDAGTRGVVVLDEVIFAREVLVEELQAAKAVTGLVVEYSWVQSSGLCSCWRGGGGGEGDGGPWKGNCSLSSLYLLYKANILTGGMTSELRGSYSRTWTHQTHQKQARPGVLLVPYHEVCQPA